VGSVYPLEPYPEAPAALIANSPWSGEYRIREVLWGYAHYGQFSKVGWQYLNGGCGTLAGGGTFVTLKSPGRDYSVIFETTDATAMQNITVNVGAGLSAGRLCVWRSDATAQFVQLAGIKPRHGCFTIALEPNAVYSISTTTGQQKGSFANVPAGKDFPFPYYETFDEYARPEQWGYLPHYTADIAGVFEIAARPDAPGQCLRQVVGHQPQSWAPEWMPYTILGDEHWHDYEVSADIYLEGDGWAGVMGRINDVGSGYGCVPKGYYFRLAANGECALYATTRSKAETDGILLAAGTAPNIAIHQWHNLKLQFSGEIIQGLVDGTQVLSATNNLYSEGMAGLVTQGGPTRSTACFDHLLINAVGAPIPQPASIGKQPLPVYP
jgi:galactosylceramidase